MKTSFLALVGLTLGFFAQAQDTQKKVEKKAIAPAKKAVPITLKVGDPAPPSKPPSGSKDPRSPPSKKAKSMSSNSGPPGVAPASS